jgi:GxxExxY protein
MADPDAALDVPSIALGLVEACREVRRAAPFGGREAVFSSMLEEEARRRGYATRREVARGIAYRGAALGNGALHREDLVVSDASEMVVVELKVAKRVEPRDMHQLYRYLVGRYESGELAHGLVVAFGETHDEAWYARVDATGVHRVRLMLDELTPCPVRTYAAFEERSSV